MGALAPPCWPVRGWKRRRFTSEEEAWYFKDVSRILPWLARTEGVGDRRGCAYIAEFYTRSPGKDYLPARFLHAVFDCFLGRVFFDFGAF